MKPAHRPRPLVASQLVKVDPAPGGRRSLARGTGRRARESIAKGPRASPSPAGCSTRPRANARTCCMRGAAAATTLPTGRITVSGNRGDTLNLDKANAKDRVEAIRVLTHRALDGQPTADLAFDALGLVAAEMRHHPRDVRRCDRWLCARCRGLASAHRRRPDALLLSRGGRRGRHDGEGDGRARRCAGHAGPRLRPWPCFPAQQHRPRHLGG